MESVFLPFNHGMHWFSAIVISRGSKLSDAEGVDVKLFDSAGKGKEERLNIFGRLTRDFFVEVLREICGIEGMKHEKEKN